jgi:hypothetical protein
LVVEREIDQSGKCYHIGAGREARPALPCQTESKFRRDFLGPVLCDAICVALQCGVRHCLFFERRLAHPVSDDFAKLRERAGSIICCLPSVLSKNEKPAVDSGLSSNFATSRKSGAGEGARTLDPDLGKVVLYH